MFELLVCVGGIYTCFLTWSTMQERVAMSKYPNGERFQYTIVLNLIQSLVASLISYLYIRVIQRQTMLKMTKSRWKRFFQVALLNSSASPFGYLSLRYINYPTMTLAKTCKMVPVMAMNRLLYNRQYPRYKYWVVLMITLGVSSFMLFKEGSSSGKENSLFGLLLVFINLSIDGAVNSTQDQVFSEDSEITGQHMMCMMNMCSSALMLLWLLNPINPEMGQAMGFLYRNPVALRDIGWFVVCGGVGQCFVFYTLARFGSLTLTTVTVTRKFLTILMSVVINGSRLNAGQWWATGVVFGGIVLDIWMKQRTSTKQEKVEEKPVVENTIQQDDRLRRRVKS